MLQYEREAKMRLKMYQVDAFADEVFSGNPAAVIPLKEWLSDKVLQSIACENNLSETAFFIPKNGKYHLRWFTPIQEVDLCGHATLAAAYVLFNHLGYDADNIIFSTRSGELVVKREAEELIMDFPAISSHLIESNINPSWMEKLQPVEVLTSTQDLMIVLSSESEITEFNPSEIKINSEGHRGVILTARGKDVDFVSRCFYPEFGVPEDPVTGSAHCQIAPYWSDKLGKKVLKARQVSKRMGDLVCEVRGDRVILIGRAVLYLEGKIVI